MLEILKSRYRLKLNKNFMRVLDACYCYYEPMLGKKITEDDTIETLMSPATMLTEYQDNDALMLDYKLSDYKNPALREINLSDTEADELIYMLKSEETNYDDRSPHRQTHQTRRVQIRTHSRSRKACA